MTPTNLLDVAGKIGGFTSSTGAAPAARGTASAGDRILFYSDSNNKTAIGHRPASGGDGVYFQNDTVDNSGFTFLESDGAGGILRSMKIKGGNVGIGDDDAFHEAHGLRSGNVGIFGDNIVGRGCRQFLQRSDGARAYEYVRRRRSQPLLAAERRQRRHRDDDA